MAALTMTPGLSISRSHTDLHPLSTLPDPRSSSATPPLSRSKSASAHHPDLNSEVASLSHKLITAINHQTDLDDTLSETRHELDAARERVRQLEAEAQERNVLVANGVLVNRKHMEDNMMELMSDLSSERKKRALVEKEKKGIELELENLTTALFEEANEMVAAARKDREIAEKRNEQLRGQLKDTELLLASHQEQLAELKSVMHTISERDDAESNGNGSTAPPTPAMQQHEHMQRVVDGLHISTDIPSEDVPPAPPTSFTHLLSPVLRTDLLVYEDFHSLLETSRKSSPSSRVTSGSYGGLSLAGLANAHREQMQHAVSNASTSSLSATTNQSSPVSPITPASTNSSVSSRDIPISAAPLKETRFYKRVLAEDIEPTLRLDSAPGLSWLARRSVISSMSEGNLVIEPMPTVATLHHLACSLCGENRKGNEYRRTHRFRTSENENAQKYSLCDYCWNRMRSTCDFLGFLRMIKDGHWRIDGAQAESTAWEESVRLRERMFWARIGGGVVPNFVRARDSPRDSIEDEGATIPATAQEGTSLEDYLQAEKTRDSPFNDREDPFNSTERRKSAASTSSTYDDGGLGIHSGVEVSSESLIPETALSQSQSLDEASDQLQADLKSSVAVPTENKVAEQSSSSHPDMETPQPQGEPEAEGRNSSSMPGASTSRYPTSPL